MNSSTQKILVTGAGGFIGSPLVDALDKKEGFEVLAVSRFGGERQNIDWFIVNSIDEHTKWHEALIGCSTVIHLAARVHLMNDNAPNPLAEFRQTNTEGTLNLARQAAELGVKRFIFLSSIKVNGEGAEAGLKFTPEDDYIPDDPYALSKWEAENGLRKLAAETGMDVVIIRPPLVYGPGVKGNFASLMRWVERGVPLPLGAVHNLRSLVALDNLVDFILLCIMHPAAANEVFLVSDGDDISTSDLLKKIANAYGRRAWLIPIPVGLMTFIARILGKKAVADRLFGSLMVDITKARDLLGWQPVVSMDEQLKKMVEKR